MSLIHKYAKQVCEARLLHENMHTLAEDYVPSALERDLQRMPSVLVPMVQKEADIMWVRDKWDARVIPVEPVCANPEDFGESVDPDADIEPMPYVKDEDMVEAEDSLTDAV